jgi:DNA-binding protein WhiA
MSFASLCKEELMKKKRNLIENKALILGMILSGAKIEEDQFVFSSTSETISKYFVFLLRRVYKYETEVVEDKIQSNKFLHTFTVSCSGAMNIMEELEVNNFGEFKKQIEESDNLAAAYLCGAFLARGSVNDPETSEYHFEITLDNPKNATFVQHVMNTRNFNAKIIKRRNRLVLYLKEAEKIVDIIRFIGATNQAFLYKDLRIERDFNNSINRIINCEVANEQKTIQAAREQLKYIKYLEYNYPLEKIDPKILTVMKVRQDNPEASLVELMEILETEYGQKISKPGLSHRFAKIKELALEHNKSKKSDN